MTMRLNSCIIKKYGENFSRNDVYNFTNKGTKSRVPSNGCIKCGNWENLTLHHIYGRDNISYQYRKDIIFVLTCHFLDVLNNQRLLNLLIKKKLIILCVTCHNKLHRPELVATSRECDKFRASIDPSTPKSSYPELFEKLKISTDFISGLTDSIKNHVGNENFDFYMESKNMLTC